jgi:hypothetical protein
MEVPSKIYDPVRQFTSSKGAAEACADQWEGIKKRHERGK